MDDAVAFGDGLYQQPLYIAGSRTQTFVLCQNTKPAATKRTIQRLPPFPEINRGSTEKNSGNRHVFLRTSEIIDSVKYLHNS